MPFTPYEEPQAKKGFTPYEAPAPQPKKDEGPFSRVSNNLKVGRYVTAGISGGVPGLARQYAMENPKESAEALASSVSNIVKTAVGLPRMGAAGIAGIAQYSLEKQGKTSEGLERFKESALKPIDVPLIGEVKTPSAVPSDAERYGTQTPTETLGQAAMTYLEAGAPGAGALVKKAATSLKSPLEKAAMKMYQSAIKVPTTMEKASVDRAIKSGLDNRVWLTEGGVKRTADRIDELEEALDALIPSPRSIAEGKAQPTGKMVDVSKIEEFVNPVRDWFNTVDVKKSEQSMSYIDETVKNFKGKYGKEIPIEEAQQLKKNTMRALRDAYGELSNVEKETQKQMARALKEGVLKESPAVGDINQKLQGLYELDQVLSRAANRAKNLNLLGISQQVAAGVGGVKGLGLTTLLRALDAPSIKSAGGIGLNELAKLAGKTAPNLVIPAEALQLMIKKIQETAEPSEF